KQYTSEVRAGEPLQLYLEIPGPGEHLVQISMRKDGAEIDKWVLARGVAFQPRDEGPASHVVRGTPPPPFPAASTIATSDAADGSAFPAQPHCGEPPPGQPRDLRPLPGGFGVGRSTPARWIEQKLAEDTARDAAGTVLAATDFPLDES